MAYKNSPSFTHTQADKIGVLLVNLGTPEAPTPKALRKYLKEFLSDPRIVDTPRLLWWFILNGFILRIRPRKSAQSYKKVWTAEGSPLLLHTKTQTRGIKERLISDFGDQIVVDFAMRYGEPSISQGIDRLYAKGVRKLLVLPLYPQYSATSSASVFDAIAADLTRRRWLPDLRFISHYHDYRPYIEAMASHISNHWRSHGKPDQLILSYHGIPTKFLHSGDPYFCECQKTSRLLAQKLGLSEDQYITTFQSRFGREQWLKPYTDKTLESLPSQGVKNIQVFCPGFSSDCLETLEEIAIENRQYFIDAGGEEFTYIPALNDNSEHLDALTALIKTNLSGWFSDPADLQHRQAQARSCGAIE